MHKKLFIPGPVEVKDDVLQKMATPMIGHRGKAASALQKSISDKLKKVFYTEEAILLSTSSGSGLMEGAIRCATAKKAAVFSIGAFGKRWHEMAVFNNVPADLFEVELGEIITAEMVDKALATGEYDSICITHNETSVGLMNPIEKIAEVVRKYPDIVFCIDAVSSMGGTKIEVDKLGVDVCITSSQKSLGLPPGFAVCSFSKKAVERAKTIKCRGFYLDLLQLYKFVEKSDQYPSTPSISHMFALDYALDKILDEGLENRYARHLAMANCVREWADKYFEVFGDRDHLSNTVTTIKNTRNISVSDLNKNLGEIGFEISNGYGALKDNTFRIAHMADMTVADIKELLGKIEEILELN